MIRLWYVGVIVFKGLVWMEVSGYEVGIGDVNEGDDADMIWMWICA